MHIDIDILVYAIIAAVLLGRLWATLGSRNDNEPQRPNPFVARAPKQQPEPDASAVSMQLAPTSRLLPSGPPPASLAGGLAQVGELDKTFNERQFLLDARGSFVAIVEAYGAGSMGSVSGMLSPELLAHFQKAVDARTSAGQKAATRVIRIKDSEVIAAQADGTLARVTVRFVSDQENTLHESNGALIGGVERKAEEVADIWDFARETAVLDSKWIVVETKT